MFRKLTSFALVIGTLTLLGCPADKPKTSDNGDSGSDGAADGSKPPVVKAAPFDIAKAKTPWKLAKVGDWALYNMVDSKKELRFEVTKVDGQNITFTVTDNKTGKLMSEVPIDMAEEDERYKDPMTYDGLARDKDGNEIKPYTESVEIGGKTIETLVVKRAGLGDRTNNRWIAENDVRPFNQGTVKIIKDGKLTMQLLDFGSK